MREPIRVPGGAPSIFLVFDPLKRGVFLRYFAVGPVDSVQKWIIKELEWENDRSHQKRESYCKR